MSTALDIIREVLDFRNALGEWARTHLATNALTGRAEQCGADSQAALRRWSTSYFDQPADHRETPLPAASLTARPAPCSTSRREWAIVAGSARACALLAVFLGMFLPGAATAAKPKIFDYEASFEKSFPVVGSEYRIGDWSLYTALVAGDVLKYAARIDPSVGVEIESLKGNGYETQQLELSIKRDKHLLAAFGNHRTRLASMVLFVDGSGVERDVCSHPLLYVDNEFRVVLGDSTESGDPLTHATVAPACPRVLGTGLQITAGRSARFKCWSSRYLTSCGWGLPDMPTDLKRVIESDYPSLVKLRWRWRGTGGVAHSGYLDVNGNSVAARDTATLTIPDDLALEFVDNGGHILWTASDPASSPR